MSTTTPLTNNSVPMRPPIKPPTRALFSCATLMGTDAYDGKEGALNAVIWVDGPDTDDIGEGADGGIDGDAFGDVDETEATGIVFDVRDGVGVGGKKGQSLVLRQKISTTFEDSMLLFCPP